jgi:hypothetical protein
MQVKIIQSQLDLEDRGKTGLSLDIGDLKTLSILNVIKDRENSNNRLSKIAKSSSQLCPSPSL